ncbi:vacuolar protein sorting-associated protein 26-domain-containing protein [Scenedesmus sp. NREL 46B-D3]|nr:vacuolar protein sorting-associated protein 26-domain-containing protein [Scenedesmus sp. NREL 46B-D3]
MQHGVNVVQPDRVKQQLFLSSLRSEACPGVLDAHGVTHILQVGFELQPSHPSRYTYLSLPVYDMVEQDIIGCFPAAFEFIDKAIASGGTVLVHCQAGISRSASVVIGYRMWKDMMSVDAATAAVQRARPIVRPNAGFKCQLRAFEAMGCDASRWQGWSMQQFLHTHYGDDSVGFMSSLLGGAPVDRLRDSGHGSLRYAAGAVKGVPAAASAAAARSEGGTSPRAAADIGGSRGGLWGWRCDNTLAWQFGVESLALIGFDFCVIDQYQCTLARRGASEQKNILGLVQGAPCRIDVDFKDEKGHRYKKTAVVKGKNGETEELPLFTNHDAIVGEVRITPLTTKRVEHSGIKVQLLGQIELASERGSPHDFVSLVRELAPPGDVASAAQKPLPFEFRNVEMQYDSYRGLAVRCRYLLRVSMTGKGMGTDSKKDAPFWVRNYDLPPEEAPPIKMEVGIEECLHIEFEYDKARYHLKDVVVGKIYFLLVRIKLKHMEVEIRRRETTGAGSSSHNESETIAKYEIMDGAPVRGENIPIRLCLSPYDLAPTYRDVHNKFSVRYFLNLVLVDEEDRRYFKQQEILLYRKADDPQQQQPLHQAPPSLGASS